MKYKTKLYVGFFSVLFIIVILLAIVLNLIRDLNNNSKDVVERYNDAKMARIISYETNNINIGLKNLIYDSNNNNMQDEIQYIETSKMKANTQLEILQHSSHNEELRKLVANIKVLHNDYDNSVNKVISFVKTGKQDVANKYIINEINPLQEKLFQDINQLVLKQEQLRQGTVTQFNSLYQFDVKLIFLLLLMGLLFGLAITIWVVHSTMKKLIVVKNIMTSVEYENIESLPRIEVNSNDEIGSIAKAYNEMAHRLEDHAKLENAFNRSMQEQNWLKSNIAEISMTHQGIQDLHTLAHLFITTITPMIGASFGVFYLKENNRTEYILRKIASYAGNDLEIKKEVFHLGEGLVGQCALENKAMITKIPADYMYIASALGTAKPKEILIQPIEFEGEVVGVIELATLSDFSALHQSLLDQISKNIGIFINTIKGQIKIGELLEESQSLTEELQSQSEELQLQQEELKSINEKLAEQYEQLEEKTKELEKAKFDLEENAHELKLNSKYKSEFLANMSHELRTPLNSLIILAQMLMENSEENLNEKQISYANTIYSSGNNLLKLINQILDLSKVESGKMDIHLDEVALKDIIAFAERNFKPIAHRKDIDYKIECSANTLQFIYTDEQKLHQIVQNLLSNAFKFTDRGTVTLKIFEVQQTNKLSSDENTVIAFSVIDTGVGIPQDKQAIIFEAFQQADGTTSRKYGGTGLGLSISREITHLLGGTIEITSTEGKGSTFTLYLPLRVKEDNKNTALLESAVSVDEAYVLELENEINFNREIHTQNYYISSNKQLIDKKILIIDGDMRNIFALTTSLESQQMKVVYAENSRDGMEILCKQKDIDLVVIEMMIPETNGYSVIQSIRKMEQFETLPIIALSSVTLHHAKEESIQAGASDYISKPINLDQLFSLMKVWLYK